MKEGILEKLCLKGESLEPLGNHRMCNIISSKDYPPNTHLLIEKQKNLRCWVVFSPITKVLLSK